MRVAGLICVLLLIALPSTYSLGWAIATMYDQVGCEGSITSFLSHPQGCSSTMGVSTLISCLPSFINVTTYFSSEGCGDSIPLATSTSRNYGCNNDGLAPSNWTCSNQAMSEMPTGSVMQSMFSNNDCTGTPQAIVGFAANACVFGSTWSCTNGNVTANIYQDGECKELLTSTSWNADECLSVGGFVLTCV